MPRVYTRKTSKGSYDKDKLARAVSAIRNNEMSGYEAAKIFEIPRSTIMTHVTGSRGNKSQTMGRNTVFHPDIERKLARSLHIMEKHGFGLSKKEVLDLVGQYVNLNNIKTPFRHGVPGTDWFLGFAKRHRLSIKKPQGVEYARKKICDPFVIEKYYNLLQRTIEELGLQNKPESIWNLDETSFCRDPTKTKVVGLVGYPSTRTISSPGRENTSVLLCCSASGTKIPPLIIFKGLNVWNEWVYQNENCKTTYAATKRGWMETAVFVKFFITNFIPCVGSGPTLLLYDGHSTHISIDLIEKAQEHNVTILKIPPHSSHLLQPLDLSVMKPLKDVWDQELVKWQRLHVAAKLPKKEFSRLISEIWDHLDPQIIKNGFSKGGIYPFNRESVSEEKYDSLALSRWKKDMASRGSLEKEVLATITIVQQPTESTHTYNLSNCQEEQRQRLKVQSAEVDPSKYVIQIPPRKQSVHIPLKAFNLNNVEKPKILSCQNITSVSGPVVDQYSHLDFSSAQASTSKEPTTSVVEASQMSFEELLLSRIARSDIPSFKKTKVAHGAEVITASDVLNRLKNENEEKVRKVENKKINNKKKEEIVRLNINKTTKKEIVEKRRDRNISQISEESSKSSWKSNESETDNINYMESLIAAEDINLSGTETEQTDLDNMQTSNNEIEEFSHNLDINNFGGRWILVKFVTKKSIKHYVGKVMAVQEDIVTATFVRRANIKRERQSVFCYPAQEDIYGFNKLDIVSVLPEPITGRRGEIIFNIAFDKKFNLY